MAKQSEEIVKSEDGQKFSTLRTLFEQAMPKFREVAPKHLSPERLVRVALATMSRNPKLIECTPHSLLSAMMTATELGLEPTGSHGGAHLVPYYNGKTKRYEAQLIPDFRGLLKLARQSGEVRAVSTEIVYTADKFERANHLEPPFVHVPADDGEESEIRGAYAWIKFSNGSSQFEFMSKAQIDRVRGASKAGSSDGPWAQWYSEMARKTVLKRALKLVPMSRELSTALEVDDRAEKGETLIADAVEFVAPPPAQSRVTALKERIRIPEKKLGPEHLELTITPDQVAPMPVQESSYSERDLPGWAGGEGDDQ